MWVATVTDQAGPTSPWNGQPAATTLSNTTVQENGTTILTQVAKAFYQTSPYYPLGENIIQTLASGTFEYTWVTVSYNGFPSTLTVGDSGTIDSGNYLMGIDPGTTRIGSATKTYVVNAWGPTQVQLVITVTGTLNGQSTSSTMAFLVNVQGQVALQYLMVDGVELSNQSL
jgi:hypothetical protein